MKLLDARQLSLKLICNVTYGYTSASFSGRMPCVEIADSIVQSGRETLEKVNIFYQLDRPLINTLQEYRIDREDPSMGRKGRLW